jgi:hypothetical protein
MTLAEDSNKVDNIVTGSMKLLQDIYTEGILSQQHLIHLPASDETTVSGRKAIVYQQSSPEVQKHWIASLPSVRFITSISVSNRLGVSTH